ncbi:MAG: beta-N-acetylhexosaminidase [Anaerolineae bacterium]|jgi:hexosaminidase|nr:beta-N-acetylhexosaminidase [Anaerolineae bacterium]
MYSIIPKPKTITAREGHFAFSFPLTIAIQGEIKLSLSLMREYFPDVELILEAGKADLVLVLDRGINQGKEGYLLDVTPEGIQITAQEKAGLFYGVQSLRQMLPVEQQGSVALDCVHIEDKPKYEWRGFMLDEARHFFGMETVKHVLDWMAALKLNIFHWHLTDYQGWRVEIQQYPLLTEIGSKRKGSQIKNWLPVNKQFDMTPYGGFYTQDEIKEIVAYAAERHITVVPEFDLPGHFTSVLAAYPELGCTKEEMEVRTEWGIFDDVACVGSAHTRNFIKNILNEFCELFPGPYIHLGGDEVKYTWWKECSDCQAEMEKQGFSDVSELHGYIMNVLSDHLLAKGKTPIVWNECLKPNLSKDVAIMHWTPVPKEMQETLHALGEGYKVIFQTHSESYYDMPHTFNPMKRAYQAKSLAAIDPELQSQVLGTQGALWTEFVRDEKRLQFQVFPREAAKAEVAWSGPAADDYFQFKKRWEANLGLFEAMGLTNPAPLAAVDPNLLTKALHAAHDIGANFHAEQQRWEKK